MAEKLVTTSDFDLNTPADGDEVIVTDGNTSHVTTGLAQYDDYDYLEFADGFLKDVGASGTYLQCNSDLLKVLHGGNAWIESNDNNGAGGEAMDDVLIQCMEADSEVFLKSGTGAMHADCMWHRLMLYRANVTLETSMIFDTNAIVSVDYVSNRGGDVTATLVAETGNGTAIPNLDITAGHVLSYKTVTRCKVEHAILEVETNPVTYLVIGEGGIVHYKHTAGTTIIVKRGGTLDFGRERRVRAIANIVACEGSRILHYDPLLNTAGALREFRQSAA